MTEAFVSQCMADHGFEYSPRPVSDVMTTEDWTVSIKELRKARKEDGYGVTRNLNLRELQPTPPATDAQWWATLGDSGGKGCLGDAERSVYSSLPENQLQYQGLYSEFEQQVRSDGRLLDGITRWRSCMRELGYSYDSPWTIATSFAARARTRPPLDSTALARLKAEEIVTASDDINCLVDQYVPVRDEVESSILNEWVAEGKIPASLWPLPAND